MSHHSANYSTPFHTVAPPGRSTGAPPEMVQDGLVVLMRLFHLPSKSDTCQRQYHYPNENNKCIIYKTNSESMSLIESGVLLLLISKLAG